MSHPPMGLSVIVPFYNEEENVIPLVQEITEALKSISFEILAIDDASQDRTLENLYQVAHSNTRVRVLSHDRNYGQSSAILTGARHASFSLLATLDGDGQNDPKDLLKLWQIYHKVPQTRRAQTVIFGNREKREDNLLRRFSSRIANALRAYMLKDLCPDTGCALKLFPREGFLNLPLFNHFHRFLPALFQLHNYQMINVNVSHRPRVFGQSKYGVFNRLWVGIYDIFGVRWLLKRKCAPKLKTLSANQAEPTPSISCVKNDESNTNFAYK